MVSGKFEFKDEGLKSKLSLIHFVYNLMFGRYKKIQKIIRENAFELNKMKSGLKFCSTFFYFPSYALRREAFNSK